DEVAAVLHKHLARGDSAGLGILAARNLQWIPPARGPQHSMKLQSALALGAGCWDADRSDLDENDVIARVIEHMRPLDPAAAARLRISDPERVLRRAERVRARAPFSVAAPHAPSSRESKLRRYLAAFGIHAPPRMEPERAKTDVSLAQALRRLLHERPRPSVVYIWSPPASYERVPELERTLAEMPTRRLAVRWVCMEAEQSIPREGSRLAEPVADALGIRLRIARERGELALRRWGLRVQRIHPVGHASLRAVPTSGEPESIETPKAHAGLSAVNAGTRIQFFWLNRERRRTGRRFLGPGHRVRSGFISIASPQLVWSGPNKKLFLSSRLPVKQFCFLRVLRFWGSQKKVPSGSVFVFESAPARSRVEYVPGSI